MEELECSQDFPHYNPMEAICCHGNQSSDSIEFWLLLFLLHARMNKITSRMKVLECSQHYTFIFQTPKGS